MRIGYDASSLFGAATGDRTYFRDLMRALSALRPQDELLLYARDPDDDRTALARSLPNARLAHLPFSVGVLWAQLALAPRLRRDGAALLHAQYTLPPLPLVPSAVTIHDISFRLFPEWFPPRARRIMDILIPLSARRADVVITGSQCARDDMIRHLGLAPEKVIVTPYAAAPHFRPVPASERLQVLEKHNLRSGYVLGVGLKGARKNVEVVLRAVEALGARGQWPRGVVLALAGSAAQFPFVERSAAREKVVFLGYVPDGDLPSLYSGALAAVYPSFYEGFGLPPLEAMACGCPVLSSDRASLPEVVGDAGLQIPPEDDEAWAEALGRVLGDAELRRDLGQRGTERASGFSWRRCAEETAAIYQKLAK